MRFLLALGIAAVALPVSAQTRLEPVPGATAASGGQHGEAMRITTYGARPAQAGRLSQRYRGLSVNRSPRRAAFGPAAPGALALGGLVMPTVGGPEGSFVRRGNSAFRVVRRAGDDF